jgi:fibronectin-binding autotransporter adhesin
VIPNLENISGSNTFSGGIYMQTGGSNVVFQSDSGTLALSGPLQYIGTLAAGRYFNFFGSGDFLVSGAILSSLIAPLGIGKYGNGTLFLRGANTFTNTINLAGGTINFTAPNNLGANSTPLAFTGGAIQFAPGNSSDISTRNIAISVGGAVIDTNTNDVTFAGGIGNKGSGGLTKTGSGTLILNGTNTYSGGTTVSSGTLAGIGTLTNAVTILNGAVLSPGPSIGTITINGSLTNFGTLLMDLHKTGPALTNDTVKGLTQIAYGGMLQLALSGNGLTLGDSFKLFFATNYSGAFTNLAPAVPGPGLAWNTLNLVTNGTLSVIANPSPLFNASIILNGQMILSGSGGYASGGYSVLASTDLATPLASWPVVGTGAFDSAGNFNFTNSIPAGTNELFFRIRVP